MSDLLIRIAHFSDTHISSFGNFLEKYFDKTADAINRLDPAPDIVIHSGDLTDNGVLEDYEFAIEKLKSINGRLVLAPGNHDERNYGQELFKEMLGNLDREEHIGRLAVYIMNSPEPDRDEGRLGRRRQAFLEEKLSQLPKDIIKVIVFHHHLVPIPYAGRETNVLEDAGDILETVLRNSVSFVFMGHRHVSRVLRINQSILINAATTSSIRTRGRLGHSFNIVDIYSDNRINVIEYNTSLDKTFLKESFDMTQIV
ncbi:metallophosphoesterase [Candidatus Bathyarchaeota archaeon]|nr:metallophosphoesterase [Candidatus Bathyarchaeota archaeon]